MKIPFTNNWGLKIIALILAIVIYYAMKGEIPRLEKRGYDKHNTEQH